MIEDGSEGRDSAHKYRHAAFHVKEKHAPRDVVGQDSSRVTHGSCAIARRGEGDHEQAQAEKCQETESLCRAELRFAQQNDWNRGDHDVSDDIRQGATDRNGMNVPRVRETLHYSLKVRLLSFLSPAAMHLQLWFAPHRIIFSNATNIHDATVTHSTNHQ